MVGRGQRRVAQRPVRGQSTHTYTHIRTRTSVTAGAVTHMFARMHRARGRRTSRREGGEGPRCPAEGRGCLVSRPCTHTHMHIGQADRYTRTCTDVARGTKVVHGDICLHETALVR